MSDIIGYRQLSAGEIEYINRVKELETSISNLWIRLRDDAALGVDKRWLNIAKTHFEEGCTAMVRSVARPISPFEIEE